jgi:hypothetical protein
MRMGSQNTTVSLIAGAPIPNVSLVLKKGVIVPIRVDDPAQLLAQNEGKTPGAQLLLGVADSAIAWLELRLPAVDSLSAISRPVTLSVPAIRTCQAAGSFGLGRTTRVQGP